MATVTVSLPADGDTMDAADYNTPITTIVNEFNGNIDSTNIKSKGIASGNYGDISIPSTALGINTCTGNDGWISTPETWTYVSANTFTVPGNQTVRYSKGTRLKWTQTTVKYGVVIGSSYGAPNTTVTIAVNTDYTIANAVISDNYYSYSANPQGYPTVFNYTPVVTAPGGTAPTYSTAIGTMSVTGGFADVNIKLQNTSGGTAGNGAVPLLVSYPIPALATLLSMGQGASYEVAGTLGSVVVRYGDSATFYSHFTSFTNVLANDQSSADRYMTFLLRYPIA